MPQRTPAETWPRPSLGDTGRILDPQTAPSYGTDAVESTRYDAARLLIAETDEGYADRMSTLRRAADALGWVVERHELAPGLSTVEVRPRADVVSRPPDAWVLLQDAR